MLKKILYWLWSFILLTIFISGVNAYYEYWPTYLKPCPVDEEVLFHPDVTVKQLLDWNWADWDYNGFVCQPSDKSQCPFGIWWRAWQCTREENTPNQYVETDCVDNVKFDKLRQLIEQGVCKKPLIISWENPDGTIYTWTINQESKEEYEEKITDSIIWAQIALLNWTYNKYIIDFNKIQCESWENQCSRLQTEQEEQKKQNELDPVELSTWEFEYNNTLIKVPTKGEDFEFNISYRNQAEYNWIIWYNRDNNWNKFLTINEDNTITYYNWWLVQYWFQAEWDKRTNINNLEITKTPNKENEYVLTNIKTNQKRYFDQQNEAIKPLRLVKYQTNWVEYNLEYDEIGYLTKLIDPNNREIVFEYIEEWVLKQNVLHKIIHPNDKVVELFYYDDFEEIWLDFDIKEIKITNQWNTRTIKFEYDTDVTYIYDNEWNIIDIIVNHKLSHNMTKMFDSKDQTYVVTKYNEDDRAQSQKYWDYEWSFVYSTDENWNITKNTATNRK